MGESVSCWVSEWGVRRLISQTNRTSQILMELLKRYRDLYLTKTLKTEDFSRFAEVFKTKRTEKIR